MIAKTHKARMEYCIVLAEKALSIGNPPVGSILVLNDAIIGEGIESGKTTKDITNHAEILAIRDAVQKGNADLIAQATMYSTHEPCIMCSYVIRHHKVAHIVFGSEVQFIGGCSSKLNVLGTEEVPKWGVRPKITKGILENRCQQLSKKYEDSLK